MPTTIDAAAPKVQEDRAVLATRQLCSTLGLGVLKPKDLKNLTTALAEVASVEAATNQEFASKILAVFHAIAPVPTPQAGRSRSTSASRPVKSKIKPIRDYDPGIFGGNKAIDPYVLLSIYGHHQLRAALEEMPPAELKRSADFVEDRHPRTKPTGRAATKPALVEYIAGHVLSD